MIVIVDRWMPVRNDIFSQGEYGCVSIIRNIIIVFDA